MIMKRISLLMLLTGIAAALTPQEFQQLYESKDKTADVCYQLYQAYAESHESDPAEINNGFQELEDFLAGLPLKDNNAVFNLCCRLCSAYERKAFLDGLQYGAHLISELLGD